MRHDTFFSEIALAQILAPIYSLLCHNLLSPTTGESNSPKPGLKRSYKYGLSTHDGHLTPEASDTYRGVRVLDAIF